MKKILTLLVVVLLVAVSCDKSDNRKPSKRPNKVQTDFFKVSYELKPYTFGESIDFEFTNIDKNNNLDSVVILAEGQDFVTIKKLKERVPTTSLLLGQNNYSFRAYFSDKSTQTKTKAIEIWGITIPEKLTYKIVNTYPHREDAYTQGLQYHNGFLYEGTGLYGQSSIRKVAIKTGEVKQQKQVPSHHFAEGISVVKDRIYQLTWKAREGYVYDLKTLNKIQPFYFPLNIEGWGMTYGEEKLIVSDGSDRLFFWNEPALTPYRFVKVGDEEQTYRNLNELEYVNGFIYANIYLSNTILKIDAKTGEVVGKIDFSSLLSIADTQKLQDPESEVLNGIAYNPDSETFYITGKHWSKLFEVKIGE